MNNRELSGRELDRALAEAMGFMVRDGRLPSDPLRAFMADGKAMALPAFSTSVDALIAGPEARLRAAGWWQWIESPGGVEYRVAWAPDHGMDPEPTTATDEPLARARAALTALHKLGMSEGAGNG